MVLFVPSMESMEELEWTAPVYNTMSRFRTVGESWDSENFCEKGVISRDGWAVIVDGPRPRFTDDPDWMWTAGISLLSFPS